MFFSMSESILAEEKELKYSGMVGRSGGSDECRPC